MTPEVIESKWELLARRVAGVLFIVWLLGWIVIPLTWGFHAHITPGDAGHSGMPLLGFWACLLVLFPASCFALLIIGVFAITFLGWAFSGSLLSRHDRVLAQIKKLETEIEQMDRNETA